MNIFLLTLLIAFLLSAVSMPIIIIFSNHFNLYDRIDNRKVHTGQISRLGGIGFTLGFTAALIILFFQGAFSSIQQNILFLLPAAVCITAMGIIDDIVSLRPRFKLAIQIIASILVLLGGFKFTGLSVGSVLNIDFGWFCYPITFAWIIGVTNAYNLIDGIDGLSGSLGTISSIAFAFFFYKADNMPAIFVCLSLGAAVCGFLLFNLPLPKAKIFMGDGGSQFIGFVLAVVPLLSSKGSLPTITLPYAAAVLMIPLFDTIAAIWRRLREHRRIDSPDKFHLHHKLMLLGFSSRSTLLIVILFQSVICIFMACSVWLGGYVSMALLFAVYLMGILFFTIIHIGKARAVSELPQE